MLCQIESQLKIKTNKMMFCLPFELKGSDLKGVLTKVSTFFMFIFRTISKKLLKLRIYILMKTLRDSLQRNNLSEIEIHHKIFS